LVKYGCDETMEFQEPVKLWPNGGWVRFLPHPQYKGLWCILVVAFAVVARKG